MVGQSHVDCRSNEVAARVPVFCSAVHEHSKEKVSGEWREVPDVRWGAKVYTLSESVLHVGSSV